jgi:YidC/Oxa1 family membrane protein insertase
VVATTYEPLPAVDHAHDVQDTKESVAGGGELTSQAVETGILGADQWFNVQKAMQLMDTIHDATGLPWWATIALSTVLIRASLFPLMVHQFRITAKLTLMKPELEALTVNFKKRKAMGEGEVAAKEHQAALSELFGKYGAKPWQALTMPFVSGPLFVTLFFALRATSTDVPSMATEGALWFTDLSQPDPYYVLPVVSAATFLGIIQRGSEGQPPGDQQKMMLWAFRGMAVAMPFFTSHFASGILVYWCSSNFFSLAQGEIFKIDFLRKLFGLPSNAEMKAIQLKSSNPYVTTTTATGTFPTPAETHHPGKAFSNAKKSKGENKKKGTRRR